MLKYYHLYSNVIQNESVCAGSNVRDNSAETLYFTGEETEPVVKGFSQVNAASQVLGFLIQCSFPSRLR